MEHTTPSLRSEDAPSIVSELRAEISGGIALPSDTQYEAARKVWNGAVPHLPAVIALCQKRHGCPGSGARRTSPYPPPFSARRWT